MQKNTEYPGPGQEDYDNVEALNVAFIREMSTLKGPQRGRLAATPFLLFSLREDDLDWWQHALVEQRQVDLISERQLHNTELLRIQTAALSFLWHLASRNPYATRIISGATIAWCEKIVDLPLHTLLDRVGTRGDLIESRLYRLGIVGQRLLGSGVSSRENLRRSAQLTALQTLLTDPCADQPVRFPAAACSLTGPMQVLDKKV